MSSFHGFDRDFFSRPTLKKNPVFKKLSLEHFQRDFRFCVAISKIKFITFFNTYISSEA